MLCDKKNIPDFSNEQIAECRKCMHASKNARENKGKCGWCCKLGVYVEKKSPIIQPVKQSIIAPSKFQMGKNFAKASAKHVMSGMKNRTIEEQKRLMDICLPCEFYIADRQKCLKCGCNMNVKLRWATTCCPINKW